MTGDLIVDGALCDDLGGSSCVVAGDLRCTALVTETDMIVGGSLHASEFVFGHYNDGSLVVEGAVTTPLLVIDDHTFEHEGKRDVATELTDPDPSELAKRFVPAAFDDESLDFAKVVKLIRKKAPILLRAKAKAKPRAKAKPKPRAKPKAKPKARRRSAR